MRVIKANPNYSITECGRVFNIKTNKEVRGHTTRYGYTTLGMSYNGISRTYRVHRLVADAYLDNPYMLPFVNHKDGNKSNNHVSNLEWCTAHHNLKHAYATGIKSAEGIKNGQHKLTESDVLEILDLWHVHNVKNKDISKLFCIARGQVSQICNGKAWQHITVNYLDSIK